MEVFNWGTTFIQTYTIDTNGTVHTDSIVIDQIFCQSSSDAHTGLKAMEMRNGFNYTTNKGISCGSWYSSDTVQTPFSVFVPITPLPSHLSFYYKYLPVNNDTALVEIEVLDSNSMAIGTGSLQIQGIVSTSTYANIPVNYTGSSIAGVIKVHFSSSSRDSNAQFGTQFLVDDISLASPTSLLDGGENRYSLIYPNPAKHSFTLNYTEGLISVRLSNCLGQEVILYKNGFEKMNINLPDGIYFAQIQSARGMEYGKLIIQE